jgi:hypothetical protein
MNWQKLISNINYKKNPEFYVYTSNTNGMLIVEPYKNKLFPSFSFIPFPIINKRFEKFLYSINVNKIIWNKLVEFKISENFKYSEYYNDDKHIIRQ